MASSALKIGFIGSGNMAQALAKGFLAAGKFSLELFSLTLSLIKRYKHFMSIVI